MNSTPPEWLQQLLTPAAYPHPVATIQLLETHISWLLLTGEFVYKIKKPLDLGFLDFSTLARRKHFCEEEYRLNHRLTPELYLGVVTIGRSAGKPRMACNTNIFEYALKLRQFEQTDMVDHALRSGVLHAEHIQRLAEDIAAFHQHIERAPPDSSYGSIESIAQPMEENFEQIARLTDSEQHRTILLHLHTLSLSELQRCTRLFEQRKKKGYIRECHGDMHLGNMVLIDNRIRLFDCIEFNPNLYWIDVISDIAFTVMDLEQRQHSGLANLLLNHYLEQTGDYTGIDLLKHYLAYRAMVRAKVACIRASQQAVGKPEHELSLTDFHHYLKLALHYLDAFHPRLLITHGLSGSGKTTVTHELMQQLGAIRLRSDIERKRLHGLMPLDHSSDRPGLDIYQSGASEQTYTHLLQLTRQLLENGYPVIVDATFLNPTHRARFQSLANGQNCPFHILHFHASPATLRRNISQRAQRSDDASEADLHVLENQLAQYTAITPHEQKHTLTIDLERQLSPTQQATELSTKLAIPSAVKTC